MTAAEAPAGKPVKPVSVGAKVPAFKAMSTAGEISLAGLAGRKVVLYFYPKDNTPGCTTEGSDFAERYKAFKAAGAEVFGVSRDSLASHEKFKAKMGYPFELISDPDEALCARFDVIKMKNMYGKQVRGIERSTFVIDESGKLIQEWRGVRVPGHAQAVLEYVKGI